MKTFTSLAIASLLASVPAGAVRAAIDTTLIPADAKWVVYADFNALRASTLGKELVTMAEQAQAGNPVGINFNKVLATVGSATAYGTTFTTDPRAVDGTLVLQGTADLRKIAESLLLQQTIASPDSVAESKDLPFPAYVVHAKGPDGTVKPGDGLIVAFPPEPVVLASKSKAGLLKAREFLKSGGASIAKTPGAPLRNLLSSSRDAYLFAASVAPGDLGIPENQPQARILKMTNSGAVAIGERGPNTFGHAELVATSDDMAEKLMKIVQGMTAVLSLAETNDKALADFLNSAAVARDDKTVTLDLTYSSERLIQMLRSLQQSSGRRSPQEEAAARVSRLANGNVVASWTAEEMAAPEGKPAQVVTHTIDNVALKNGSLISLGRQSNGGRPVRFDRVEIAPTGGGASLTFRAEFMRNGGAHGTLSMFEFPGSDGTYTLRVSYTNDPDGKAQYVVSIRNPKAPPAPAPGNN